MKIISPQDCKILFIGTSEFSVDSLQILIEKKFNIVGIITQPDKPMGRKHEITPPPIKKFVSHFSIPLFQPASLKDSDYINKLMSLDVDLLVVVAYGKIIPQSILKLPRYGAINVHPSLLPKYRGPSPIQTAIRNGDTETGVTIMLLDELMDHGPILTQNKLPILPKDNSLTLHQKLAKLGATSLFETILPFLNHEIIPMEQDHSRAVICKMLSREDGEITSQMTTDVVFNSFRAFVPWPGIYIKFNEKKIKIIEIKKSAQTPTSKHHFFHIQNKLFLNCQDGTLELITVQPEGKNPMNATSFINGYLLNKH